MQYTSIVVGTDGSEAANETVRQGAALARVCGATLHIVAAYRRLSRRERERVLRDGPAGLNTRLRHRYASGCQSDSRGRRKYDRSGRPRRAPHRHGNARRSAL